MKVLNSFQLKMIAIVTMTIDHIGFYLYPTTDLYRIIGRICFPLIAYLITEGYRHTSDIKQYVLRLSAFALIIQVGLFIANQSTENIFIILSIGLLLIYLIENDKLILAIPLIAIPHFIPTIYGYYGVFLIVLMYYGKDIIAIVLLSVNIFFIEILPMTELQMHSMPNIQYYSLLAIPFILMYNGKQGKRMKYFFYIYYPIHIVIILLVKEFLYA